MFFGIFKYILGSLKERTTRIFKIENTIKVYDFFELKFTVKNQIELFRTLYFGGEKISLAAFLFLQNENDCVWDIGASVGLYSLHSAKICKKVISFEPDKEIFERLNYNILINNLNNKIKLFNLAIGNIDGEIDFYTDGVIGNSPSIKDLKRHHNSKKVLINKIDTLIDNNFEKPTILKIDIEGAEYEAIQGATNLLSSDTKPRIIFIEIHPQFLKAFATSENKIINSLKEFGYKTISTFSRDKEYHLICVI